MIANQISEFSWGLAVQQLANATAKRPEPNRRFNPRPAGVIQAGSTTDAVLAFLADNPRRYFTNGELMRVTGRSHAAVSWSLMFLRHKGLIEAAPDEHRNKKYLHYAVWEEKSNARRSEPRTEESQTRVENDDAPLPGAGVPVVRKVRRKRNPDLSAVDELSPVSEQHGTAADHLALAGPAQHEQALHARQHDLDASQSADTSAPILPSGDRTGGDADCSGGRATTWVADQEHRAASMGSGLQFGAPQAAENLQAVDVAYASGRDAATADLGPTHRDTEQLALVPDQAGNDHRDGIDTQTISLAPRDSLNTKETVNTTV